MLLLHMLLHVHEGFSSRKKNINHDKIKTNLEVKLKKKELFILESFL